MTIRQLQLYIEGWTPKQSDNNHMPSKADLDLFNLTAGIERIPKRIE